jgi:hypothetical protein
MVKRIEEKIVLFKSSVPENVKRNNKIKVRCVLSPAVLVLSQK